MYAVIELPDFSLQALLRLRPDLCDVPVALLAGEGRRAIVAATNAAAAGLPRGVTSAQALADCPGVRLVQPSLEAEREAGALLLAAGWKVAPLVEPTAPGCCTIDLAGSDPTRLPSQLEQARRFLAAEELVVRIGVAPTPLVARYAAHTARPVHWVQDSLAFLAPLPVAMLDLKPDEAQLLADLGLRTLGKITAFPRAALTGRLGARGDQLWARAAGEERRPLAPAAPPVRHCAEFDLENPVETLEPLLFLLRRFCDRLAAEVGQFGGGTGRLTLTLKLEDDTRHTRDFALPEPTAQPGVLFAVLENHLATLQTPAPVTGVMLEVYPARRLEQQNGLFDTGLQDAPMFYATLGRLAAVVGAEHVGTPHRGDSHRADDLRLRPPSPAVPVRQPPAAPPPHGPLLWRLRPPRPATVELTETQPTFLASDFVSGPVTVIRRPFRAVGEWWAADGGWAREEWDVAIGGSLYRLRHEPAGWFIEGCYD